MFPLRQKCGYRVHHKIENGQTKNEGLCLKCARELHIKPVDDVINKMGISDEDLDSITGDMMNALSGVEDMMDVDNDGSDDSEDDGKTATFPFLNRLFGGPRLRLRRATARRITTVSRVRTATRRRSSPRENSLIITASTSPPVRVRASSTA